ncbi:unnamed protein product [Brachionus calyciflorus]|uniref:Arf-GAP domain-containing protein n=1 Tax=Brachionus calyciflorus TaxID=104777 RepID=A0A813RD63_9BILA|nr:unnamed protein product [Brachionus calyciflorus]
MSVVERPKLPVKLPLEQRKKLSITFTDYDSSSIDSGSRNFQVYYDGYYIQPIDQPVKLKHINNEPKTNSFFNDSIYCEYENQETDNSISEINEDKSDRCSYFSLDKFTSEDKSIISTDKSSCLSDTSFNLSESISSLVIDETKPPIPPKRTKKLLSLSHLNLSCQKEIVRRESSFIDECFNYLSPENESKKYFNLEEFRSEIFKNSANKVCADCKRSDIIPNWISCVYFITLCDFCAECHLKLSHYVSIFYVIKISLLYDYLKENESKKSLQLLDPEAFINIFNQAGNDKINSLIEYNSNDSLLQTKPQIEEFIKQKYVHKKFIIENQYDLSTNYLDDFNKALYQIVSGPCISMTIYYLFLGANRNYFQNEKTILDIALESNQKYQYLYLITNKSLMYSQLKNEANLEYLGDAIQIYNLTSPDRTTVKKIPLNLKLKNNDLIMTQFDSNRIKSQKINLNSIIKIFQLSESSVELKWCTTDHCILSHFLEFNNSSESQIWLKNIILKFKPSLSLELNNIFNYLNIKSFGFLNLDHLGQEQKVLIALFETQPSQVEKYFQKFIILIYINSDNSIKYEVIDIRKLNKLKLEKDTLLIDTPGRIFRLKSDGYGQNLKLWFDKLTCFIKLEFKSIEEQYLDKDNCVLLVEKCCSFIELNFLTQANFYPINFKFFKKGPDLYSKLKRDKNFKIETKRTKIDLILTCLKIFFSKYVKKFHGEVLDKENLKSLSESVFFSTLKRVILHLNFVHNYKNLNKMNLEDLSKLYTNIIFGDNTEINLVNMIENCEDYFGLKKGYLNFQYQIFDRFTKLKNLELVNLDTSSNRNFLITIYLFHKHSEQSFQLQIDENFTCKDALIKAKDEFNLYESKYWCLFEIFDHEQHLALQGLPQEKSSILLERVLPSKAKLIESISNWNSFNFIVKYNQIQIDFERFYITNEAYNLGMSSFLDKCQCLVLCNICGIFRTSFSKHSSGSCSSWHKKWTNSILSVRNANLKLLDASGKNLNMENFDLDSNKVLYEEIIEDCLFYYGLYEHNALKLSHIQHLNDELTNESSISKLISNKNKNSAPNSSEIMINEEECLTFYDKKMKLVYLIHFENKELALTRYCNLFKLAYFPDTWSIFKSDQMPNLKPKIPEMRKTILSRESQNRIS